ncbi:MAG: Crp/Fnr family transcriptional regulator [Bacteroidota bacterium]
METNDLIEFNSTPEIKEKLKKYGFTKKFSEDDVILNENAYIKAIPIVVSGSIKVIRTDEDGREILLYYIRPGESCIMSFLGGIHNDTSKVKAIAEESTEILFIPIDKVNELIREYPEWLDYIFRLYHRRFEELLEVVNDVAFKKMDERLLSFLRKKAEMANSSVILVTHEQLANELGTVRVVISRLLKQMEDEGMVALGRHKITLLDKKLA